MLKKISIFHNTLLNRSVIDMVKCSLRIIYCVVHLIKNWYKLIKWLKIVLKWQAKFNKITLLALHPIKLIKKIWQKVNFIDINLFLKGHLPCPYFFSFFFSVSLLSHMPEVSVLWSKIFLFPIFNVGALYFVSESFLFLFNYFFHF